MRKPLTAPMWLTIYSCTAVLVVFLVWPHSPYEQNYPPTTVPKWISGVASLYGLTTVLVQLAFREGIPPLQRRVVLAWSWSSFCLLALSGGAVFELLALLQVIPSRSDGLTVLLRGLAIMAAVSVAHLTLSYSRASTTAAVEKTRVWSRWSYAACLLALPYLVLKTYWALGGQHGFAQADTLELHFGGSWGTFLAGWGTVIAAAVGAMIALAQIRPWGRRLPTGTLPVAGWTGAAMLLSAGVSGIYGVIRSALDPAVATPHFVTGWVLPVVYGNFAAWGIALVVATSHHQHARKDAFG